MASCQLDEDILEEKTNEITDKVQAIERRFRDDGTLTQKEMKDILRYLNVLLADVQACNDRIARILTRVPNPSSTR